MFTPTNAYLYVGIFTDEVVENASSPAVKFNCLFWLVALSSPHENIVISISLQGLLLLSALCQTQYKLIFISYLFWVIYCRFNKLRVLTRSYDTRWFTWNISRIARFFQTRFFRSELKIIAKANISSALKKVRLVECCIIHIFVCKK